MKSRDQAFEVYLKTCAYNSAIFDSERKRAFEAGWNARKQLDYEAALGIKRPLHASSYEPLTPFKPRNPTEEAIVARIKDPPFGDAHVGGSPPSAKQFAGRKFTVVHGGDQVHGKLHDG